MPGQARILAAGTTDVGRKRTHNEDFFALVEAEHLRLGRKRDADFEVALLAMRKIAHLCVFAVQEIRLLEQAGMDEDALALGDELLLDVELVTAMRIGRGKSLDATTDLPILRDAGGTLSVGRGSGGGTVVRVEVRTA